MITLNYNSFAKNSTSKTGYIIDPGQQPFSTPNIYVRKPDYVHSKAPIITISNGSGLHVTSLYGSGVPGLFIGDYKGNGLLATLGGGQLEIFLSDVPRPLLRSKLLAGELNSLMEKARKSPHAHAA